MLASDLRASLPTLVTQTPLKELLGRYFSKYTDNVDASKKSISSLIEDSKGNLWFGVWGEGVYRYDGKSFTNFTTKDGLPSEVTRIIEDQKGNLWFGASDGLRRYDGKTFTNFKDGLINPWIWEILEDKNGNIWVGTRESGLYFFNGKKYQGGQEYNISTPINRIPVFRKTNKLLDNIIFPEEADL